MTLIFRQISDEIPPITVYIYLGCACVLPTLLSYVYISRAFPPETAPKYLHDHNDIGGRNRIHDNSLHYGGFVVSFRLEGDSNDGEWDIPSSGFDWDRDTGQSTSAIRVAEVQGFQMDRCSRNPE